MTEQDQTTPTLDAGDALPVDFDLDDWLDGGSVVHRSVDIYNRPDLVADYEDWQRRWSLAEDRAKTAGDEQSLADADDEEAVALRAEGERIHAEWLASKSTWRVRALDQDTEVNPIAEAAPKPVTPPQFRRPQPQAPRDYANGKPAPAYEKALEDWTKEREEFFKANEDEIKRVEKTNAEIAHNVDLAHVAAAVVSIEFPGGKTINGVTVDQLRKLEAKIGRGQFNRLLLAAIDTLRQEPTVPVPFSQTSSKGARG